VSAPAGLSRDELPGRVVRVLSRGGWGNPDVYLVRGPERAAVVKDFAPRPRWFRRLLAPWLVERELRAYRAAEGVEAVPRVLGRVDALAFALEYRPGEPLGRGLRGRLPERFLDELRAAVTALHRRGVVHLDLRHRSNVLAGADGHPVLLDFAAAVVLSPERWPGRWVLRWLAPVDRAALRKWEARLGPTPPRR